MSNTTGTANKAAYQPVKGARQFEVKEAPYPKPSATQLVIRNHAVAINPMDWLLQRKADIMYTWLKYPFVFGMDVAGEVVAVGSSVTRFKPGDRVCGLARGTEEKINDPTQGGFQLFTILESRIASPIPSNMSYDSGSTIPLALCTGIAGLFGKDQLALEMPSLESKSKGKTVIVWGGSTSVGCMTIQLAVAAGYEVFATCSPRNFELCKKLGAAQVFDYNSKTLVPDMVAAFKGKTSAGAMTIGDGGAEACMDILTKVQGNRFIAMASFPVLREEPKSFATLKTMYHFVSWIAAFKAKGALRGVKSNFLNGGAITYNDIGPAVWEGYLPQALEQGKIVPAPEVYVFGEGLDKLQEACDFQSKGVSAKKVVVHL